MQPESKAPDKRVEESNENQVLHTRKRKFELIGKERELSKNTSCWEESEMGGGNRRGDGLTRQPPGPSSTPLDVGVDR